MTQPAYSTAAAIGQIPNVSKMGIQLDAIIGGCDETRCDLSDWAVNTLRDALGSKVTSALYLAEARRITNLGVKPNHAGLVTYLRTRRVGAVTPLNRGLRRAVFAAWACRQ